MRYWTWQRGMVHLRTRTRRIGLVRPRAVMMRMRSPKQSASSCRSLGFPVTRRLPLGYLPVLHRRRRLPRQDQGMYTRDLWCGRSAHLLYSGGSSTSISTSTSTSSNSGGGSGSNQDNHGGGSTDKKSDTGAIAGGVIGGLAVLGVVIAVVWMRRTRRRRDNLARMGEVDHYRDDRLAFPAPRAPSTALPPAPVASSEPESQLHTSQRFPPFSGYSKYHPVGSEGSSGSVPPVTVSADEPQAGTQQPLSTDELLSMLQDRLHRGARSVTSMTADGSSAAPPAYSPNSD